ncbi:ImmA/IrrE family metallo-endopeptidase [Geothrix sp. 21YS21S-2]|uniref:ImmA/IrrE family metallo-endopeptidase n=1 Tax=Geothrix sp. 21YS21S-2 TaxID=3068893 RepID=UPI0027B9F522|nr:XRE family transcriptional regulator [Geothrix sp. 21YS21S-2]
MAARAILAKCNPALIKWSRCSAHLTMEEVSRRTKIPIERLEGYESGSIIPSFPQLQLLAKTLKRALPLFFLPLPPDHEDVEIEFRSLSAFEQEVADQISALRRRVESQKKKVLRSCFENLDTVINKIDKCAIVFDDNHRRIAKELRALVGISLSEQFSWKKPDKALRHWKEAIEALGIFVIQNEPNSEKVPVDIFRGFVLPALPFPVIVLNCSDAQNGKIFTLIHELCHLAHIISIGKGATAKRYRTREFLETICNRVAAEFLCPEDDLGNCWDDIATPSQGKTVTTAQLKEMTAHFSVSAEMLLIRLQSLGYITESCQKQHLARIKVLSEEANKERGPVIIPYHILAVNRNGKALSTLVIKALGRGSIDFVDASNCLGIRSKHIAKIGTYLLAQNS